MVNNAVIASTSPPSTKQCTQDDDASSSSSASTATTIEPPASNTDEDTSSKSSSLCCSVPLDKVQGVLTTFQSPKQLSPNPPSRKLLCLYCDRTFVCANLRQKHVERVHSSKTRRVSARRSTQLTSTPCFHCDKLNSSEHTLSDLFQHLTKEHPSKYFGCLTCEDRFLSVSLLKDHEVTIHNLLETKDYATVALVKLEELDDSDVRSDELPLIKLTRSKLKLKSNSEEISVRKSENTNNKLIRGKRLGVKSSKIALKRSKRLQALAKESESLKKKQQNSNNRKLNTKLIDKSINPYPEFDNFYRIKKITDHSIDNLKISSLTFDDVFDKAFFNRIKCNIEENLLHYIDGKLFKNEESESRISNFEKINTSGVEIQSSNIENFGCDVSLNAVTPVASLVLNSQFGEDFESQVEYGAKPSKKKTPIKTDEVHYKYFTRRKFQASILQQKENRDLSKLDIWTQLVIKKRQQKIVDDKKTAKEMLEYTGSDEYKSKLRREELNRILDRRGPFEDLKEEASKQALLDNHREALSSTSSSSDSDNTFSEIRDIVDFIVASVSEAIDEVVVSSDCKLSSDQFVNGAEDRVIPSYLNLVSTSSLPSESEIDRSDHIALICSSQETENFELPTNAVRKKDEVVELTGEWARSRMYICAACGNKFPNMKYLLEHKTLYHQNVWVQHYEMVGNQSELYRHLSIPVLGKVGVVELNAQCKLWKRSDARLCAKCSKQCNSLGELHRHILECGEDWTWMMVRKKCKYRPFGAKSRRKRRGLVHRIHPRQKTDPSEKKTYKKIEGPRQRPSDADTIQRMLANLPAKRCRRNLVSLQDVIYPRRRRKITDNSDSSAINTKETSNNKKKLNTTRKKSSNRSLRNLNKVLSSRILDTNASRIVKRKLKALREEKRVTRQALLSVDTKSISNKDSNQSNTMKRSSPRIAKNTTSSNYPGNKKLISITSFFPVKKKNQVQLQDSKSNNSASKEEIPVKRKRGRPFKNIKAALNVKQNTNQAEEIVVEESQPSVVPTEPLIESETVKKRKLTRNFRSVIDKVKKLKLTNNTPTADATSLNVKECHPNPGSNFLEKNSAENEDKVVIPLERKENLPDNIGPVLIVANYTDSKENPPIPETMFNLESNNEKNLQAKGELDFDQPTNHKSLTDAVVKNDELKATVEDKTKPINIEISPSTVKTTPLTSPNLSKGKIKKPNRGLNDCIAMLTSKLHQKEQAAITIDSIFKQPEEPKPQPKPECILRIPKFKVSNTSPQSCEETALDLSKKSNPPTPVTPLVSDTIGKVIEDVIENKCKEVFTETLKTTMETLQPQDPPQEVLQKNSIDETIEYVISCGATYTSCLSQEVVAEVSADKPTEATEEVNADVEATKDGEQSNKRKGKRKYTRKASNNPQANSDAVEESVANEQPIVEASATNIIESVKQDFGSNTLKAKRKYTRKIKSNGTTLLNIDDKSLNLEKMDEVATKMDDSESLTTSVAEELSKVTASQKDPNLDNLGSDAMSNEENFAQSEEEEKMNNQNIQVEIVLPNSVEQIEKSTPNKRKGRRKLVKKLETEIVPSNNNPNLVEKADLNQQERLENSVINTLSEEVLATENVEATEAGVKPVDILDNAKPPLSRRKGKKKSIKDLEPQIEATATNMAKIPEVIHNEDQIDIASDNLENLTNKSSDVVDKASHISVLNSEDNKPNAQFNKLNEIEGVSNTSEVATTKPPAKRRGRKKTNKKPSEQTATSTDIDPKTDINLVETLHETTEKLEENMEILQDESVLNETLESASTIIPPECVQETTKSAIEQNLYEEALRQDITISTPQPKGKKKSVNKLDSKSNAIVDVQINGTENIHELQQPTELNPEYVTEESTTKIMKEHDSTSSNDKSIIKSKRATKANKKPIGRRKSPIKSKPKPFGLLETEEQTSAEMIPCEDLKNKEFEPKATSENDSEDELPLAVLAKQDEDTNSRNNGVLKGKSLEQTPDSTLEISSQENESNSIVTETIEDLDSTLKDSEGTVASLSPLNGILKKSKIIQRRGRKGRRKNNIRASKMVSLNTEAPEIITTTNLSAAIDKPLDELPVQDESVPISLETSIEDKSDGIDLNKSDSSILNTSTESVETVSKQRTRRKSKSFKKINNDLFKDFALVINKKTKRIPPTSIVDDSVCDDSPLPDIDLALTPHNQKNVPTEMITSVKEPVEHILDDSVEEMDMELEEIAVDSNIIERTTSEGENTSSTINLPTGINDLGRAKLLEPTKKLQNRKSRSVKRKKGLKRKGAIRKSPRAVPRRSHSFKAAITENKDLTRAARSKSAQDYPDLTSTSDILLDKTVGTPKLNDISQINPIDCSFPKDIDSNCVVAIEELPKDQYEFKVTQQELENELTKTVVDELAFSKTERFEKSLENFDDNAFQLRDCSNGHKQLNGVLSHKVLANNSLDNEESSELNLNVTELDRINSNRSDGQEREIEVENTSPIKIIEEEIPDNISVKLARPANRRRGRRSRKTRIKRINTTSLIWKSEVADVNKTVDPKMFSLTENLEASPNDTEENNHESIEVSESNKELNISVLTNNLSEEETNKIPAESPEMQPVSPSVDGEFGHQIHSKRNQRSKRRVAKIKNKNSDEGENVNLAVLSTKDSDESATTSLIETESLDEAKTSIPSVELTKLDNFEAEINNQTATEDIFVELSHTSDKAVRKCKTKRKNSRKCIAEGREIEQKDLAVKEPTTNFYDEHNNDSIISNQSMSNELEKDTVTNTFDILSADIRNSFMEKFLLLQENCQFRDPNSAMHDANLEIEKLKAVLGSIKKTRKKNSKLPEDILPDIEPLTQIITSSDIDIAPVIDEINKSLEIDDIYDFNDDEQSCIVDSNINNDVNTNVTQFNDLTNKVDDSSTGRGATKACRTAKIKALEHIHDEALFDMKTNDVSNVGLTKNPRKRSPHKNKRKKSSNIIENHANQELDKPEQDTNKLEPEPDCIPPQSVEVEQPSSVDNTSELNHQELRRSRRGLPKVISYNENDLIDPIVDALEKCRKSMKKDKPVETSTPLKSLAPPQEKLNSEELFDLLKTSMVNENHENSKKNKPPSNLVANNIEASNSTRDFNEFDNVFENILEKSTLLVRSSSLITRNDVNNIYEFIVSSPESSSSDASDVEAPPERSSIIEEQPVSISNNSINEAIDSNSRKSKNAKTSEQNYCEICRKSFIRFENLVKHKTTLTHISKLSEIEAKEAAEKQLHEASIIEEQEDLEEATPPADAFPNANSLKLADIISDVLEPNDKVNGFIHETNQHPPEYRRCKSLGERKSFDSDKQNDALPTNNNYFEQANSKTTILEKQISILENIIEHETGALNNFVINNSDAVSIISSRDSTNSSSMNDDDTSKLMNTTSNCVIPTSFEATFLKPVQQYEEISGDSMILRNSTTTYDDTKLRKTLNRDEELFLECCSLLKSSSESKAYKHSLLKRNNHNPELHDEEDLIEWSDPKNITTKNLVQTVEEAHEYSDNSRTPTPLGDAFDDDASDSNTITSNWDMKKGREFEIGNKRSSFSEENCEDAVGSNNGSLGFGLKSILGEISKDVSLDEDNRASPVESTVSSNDNSPDYAGDDDDDDDEEDKPDDSDVSSSECKKIITKGARKVFEGLRVSIPTNDLNLEEVLNGSFLAKKNIEAIAAKPVDKECVNEISEEDNDDLEIQSIIQTKEDYRFKQMKNIEDANVKKKPSPLPSDRRSKIGGHDVYDFEETQDNVEVFTKPDFRTFRSQKKDNVDTNVIVNDVSVKDDVVDGTSDEIVQSSSSVSSVSVKSAPPKNNLPNITKKKCMIMGRIFKNAVAKSKVDEIEEEIREIPEIGNIELVENYVNSCAEQAQKPKMSEQEMNQLFDQLLGKPLKSDPKPTPPKPKQPITTNNSPKKKPSKFKTPRKRSRAKGESSDDEFNINKTRKRTSKKQKKEDDNCINLEQELKECIGVASRKSQRKCTSGKQNVLVEYWSSDEEAFEAMLESKKIVQTEDNLIVNSTTLDDASTVLGKEIEMELMATQEVVPPPPPKVLKQKKTPNENRKPKSQTTTNSSSSNSNRRKRAAAHPLYHWSSSSEDESQNLIEVKPIRDDEPDDEEDRPVQHGWIVGDSPKKLVTMLALIKGKNKSSDHVECCVKEQNSSRKRTSNGS